MFVAQAVGQRHAIGFLHQPLGGEVRVPAIGEDRGRPMSGADDVHGLEIALLDYAIEMHVDEIEPGRGAPVAHESRLDVLATKRLSQQGIVEQVDLSDGEIVRRPPIGIDQLQLLFRQCISHESLLPQHPRSTDGACNIDQMIARTQRAVSLAIHVSSSAATT